MFLSNQLCAHAQDRCNSEVLIGYFMSLMDFWRMRRNANKRSVSEMVPCSLSLFPPTASFGHLLIAVHCGYCPCFLACVLNNLKKTLKYSEKGAGYTDMTLEQFFFSIPCPDPLALYRCRKWRMFSVYKWLSYRISCSA